MASTNLRLVNHDKLSLSPSHEAVTPTESLVKFGAPDERRLWPEDGKAEYKLGDRVSLVVQARIGKVEFERGTQQGADFKKNPDGTDVRRVQHAVVGMPRLLTQREALAVETALADLSPDGKPGDMAYKAKGFIKRHADAIVSELPLKDRENLASILLGGDADLMDAVQDAVDGLVDAGVTSVSLTTADLPGEPGTTTTVQLAPEGNGDVQGTDGDIDSQASPFVDGATGEVIGDADALVAYLKQLGEEATLGELLELNGVADIDALAALGHGIDWGEVQGADPEPEAPTDPVEPDPEDAAAPTVEAGGDDLLPATVGPQGLVMGDRSTYTEENLRRLKSKQAICDVLADLGANVTPKAGDKDTLVAMCMTMLEEAPAPADGLDFTASS